MSPFSKARLIVSCLAMSALLHLCTGYAVNLFGSWHLGAAVSDPPAVMVDLAGPAPSSAETAVACPASQPEPASEGDGAKERESSPVVKEADALAEEDGDADDFPVAAPAPSPSKAEAAAAPAEAVEHTRQQVAEAEVAKPQEASAQKTESAAPNKAAVTGAEGQPRVDSGFAGRGKEIFSAKYEKLSYAISMLGVPIGRAELEARNDDGVTTITLKVNSSPAVAGIYPVADYIETRHIDGRYLMTKIRQQEGNFRSDEAFTINLQKRRVSWSDNINYRNLKLSVPTDDVLDSLSGIYSLRNRQLQVGKTETLHIFDSEAYGEVPVEIVRREELRLSNLRKVAALVVRPVQKTAGMFRRTGDVLIWMTDDAEKVPVRIVTTIALGKVTAELVSAETDRAE